MRSIRVFRNVVTNYLRFFLGGILGFVLTPLMVHLLGDGDYGLWVTVFSLTGYFGLFDQGIRPSLVRYVSRDHARADDQGLSRTVSSALALYSAVGVLTLAATAVVALQFTHWFKVEPSQVAIAREVVLLAGVSVALGFPFGVFGATLSGLQRYDIANAIGILVSVVRAFAFFTVLKLGWGLLGLAWASLVMNLLGHGLSLIYARRALPQLELGWRFITRVQLKLIGSYSSFAFVGALATSIAFQTDAIVITAFIGAAAVTPFALAASLVDHARSLVYSATWVLSPTASELETRGENSKLHGMMIMGSKYAVLLSWPVLFALIIFGHNLIVTWVDNRHTEAVSLLMILAVPTLVSLPQSATSSVLFGISRHRGVVTLSLLNSLLNLGLSLLWVKPFGLAGVAMGTAVPLALISGIATLVYGCHALELPLGRYLWEGMIHPGLMSLAFVIPAGIAQAVFRPVGWTPLGLTVGSCWIVFAACAWRFGLNAEERGRWARMVSGLLGSRNADRTPEVAA